MSRDVLDLIDAALDDYATSTDAMRWAPDAPDPTVGPERLDPGPTDGSCYVQPAELWDRAIVDETHVWLMYEIPVFCRIHLNRTVKGVSPLAAAVAERQVRLRRMHTEYRRRTRHRRTR